MRLYEHLMRNADPDLPFEDQLNPNSLTVIEALIEPALAEGQPGDLLQFLRQGYFCIDSDSTPERPVFNRTVGLTDTWAKMAKNMQPSA